VRGAHPDQTGSDGVLQQDPVPGAHSTGGISIVADPGSRSRPAGDWRAAPDRGVREGHAARPAVVGVKAPDARGAAARASAASSTFRLGRRPGRRVHVQLPDRPRPEAARPSA
jgi:hypothetical protein